MFHANRNEKKAGVALFIQGKIDFKIRHVRKDKEGHRTIKGQCKRRI